MQLQSYNFVQQRITVLANWLWPNSLEKLSFVEEWGQKPAKFRREKMENGTGRDQVPFFGLQLLTNEAIN